MTDAVLRVERVSKRYRIGRAALRHDSLRDAITYAAARSLRRLAGGSGRSGDDSATASFWALRDVTFDVKRGEVLGIIGRNGAGKSTLLKVLSRITYPTIGRVTAYGRIGSLLEVGTGFHPDLTGRENVYLNGSVLGMRKAEVDRKFDEIVAFSGVESFLDTPVKRYSSGMYVRLAFAVAAHLEPEVLIVDEVLAVGDVEFQRRCLRKMETVARGGRTVLLVSHNMSTVQTFCTRAILLQDGSIAAAGTPEEAVSAYLRGLEAVAAQNLLGRRERLDDSAPFLTRCEVRSDDLPHGVLATGRAARFIFGVGLATAGTTLCFSIHDSLGRAVTFFDSSLTTDEDAGSPNGATDFRCELDEVLLIPGRYRIDVAIWGNGEVQDRVEGAAFFDVEEGSVRGRALPQWTDGAIFVMPHQWSVPFLASGAPDR